MKDLIFLMKLFLNSHTLSEIQ